MSEEDACSSSENLSIQDIILKIRAASYRVGFNLWDIFRNLEEPTKLVTPEHKFLSVLGGPLKQIIGLSDKDLLRLVSYFRVTDGRISYDQFCRMVHDGPPQVGNKEREELDDPFTVNKLSPLDEQRLMIVLTKIATSLEKPLVIKPYFMDYELQKKGSGMVTVSSFFRVLSFLGIQMSNYEANLLQGRYSRNKNIMKYAAFINDINNIRKYLKDRQILDMSSRLLPVHHPTIPNLKYSLLPRVDFSEPVEVGVKRMMREGRAGTLSVQEMTAVLDKLRSHVFEEKIRVEQFFKLHDASGSGKVPIPTLKMFINWVRLGRKKMNDTHFSPNEVRNLCSLYQDPANSEDIIWTALIEDIYQDFPSSEVESWPSISFENPKRSPVSRLPCATVKRPPSVGHLSEEDNLQSLSDKMVRRKVNLKTIFTEYDPTRSGYLSEYQFENAMREAGFLFTRRELIQLRDRYATKGGFNYMQMIVDLEDLASKQQMHTIEVEDDRKEHLREEAAQREQLRRETNVVEVLAKIKKTIICSRLSMLSQINKYDPNKTGVVDIPTFKKCTEDANLNLTDREFQTLCDVFHKSNDKNLIEYQLFAKNTDEGSIMPCLQRQPLKVLMAQKYEPKKPMKRDFVNFEDRIFISHGMKTLCHYINLGNIDMFKALDPHSTGVVSKSQLMHLLFELKVLHLISNRTLEAIMKGFGYEEGLSGYLDYTTFLNALDTVFRTEKAALTQ